MPWVENGGKRDCHWFTTSGLCELLIRLKMNLRQSENKEGRKIYSCRPPCRQLLPFLRSVLPDSDSQTLSWKLNKELGLLSAVFHGSRASLLQGMCRDNPLAAGSTCGQKDLTPSCGRDPSLTPKTPFLLHPLPQAEHRPDLAAARRE